MNNSNIVIRLCLALLLIMLYVFFLRKIGLFEMIGGSEPSPNGLYRTVTVKEISDAIENNIIAAKDEYEGKYVSITGEIGDFDSSSISIYQPDDTFSLDYVLCRIKDDSQKNLIKTMNKGDIVTVKGKIIDMGEIIGCHLNIIEIYKSY